MHNSTQIKSMRLLKRKINECDEIIENAKNAKKQKKELENQLKSLKMDLVKDEKIKWKEMSFQHWMEETEYKTFYIWYVNGEYDYGVWEGEERLTDDEHQHFKEFYKHYFFQGYPNYNEHDEMTEMEHGFEDGDLKISEVYRDDL
ncbi:MAG: hypothetical protein CMF41_01155 [Legionellales bacterium]|nr:hypothetical protein [Legionellales bacterium]|tara:strand:- start:758 stop:1192 length:435 start_codon:yes stop_codon:yes gene_type:complete